MPDTKYLHHFALKKKRKALEKCEAGFEMIKTSADESECVQT